MIKGSAGTVRKARSVRRAMTWPEVLLWQRLRTRPAGLKFRRQHPAGPYVLDFYRDEARLAIEVDGLAHDLETRPHRDEARDRWLGEQGITVVRVSAGEVTRDPDAVVAAIVEGCVRK